MHADHGRYSVIHRGILSGLAGLVMLGLLLRIGLLGSAVQANVGMLILSRALLERSSTSLPEDLSHAERRLRAALAWNDANTAAHHGLAWVLKLQRRDAQATAEWRAAGLTAQYLVTQGELALRAERYEEALMWYEILAVVDPALSSTVDYLKYVVHKTEGNAESGMANLQAAVSIDTGWSDPEMRFRAWYLWGSLLHQEGRAREAEEALLKAIASYPEGSGLESLLSHSYRLLSRAQWAQAKLEQAVQSMEGAVEHDQQNFRTLHHMLQMLDKYHAIWDGQRPLVVWRLSRGALHGLAASSEGSYDSVFQQGRGQDGEVPVGGDLDGDGEMDIVVWRPSDGMWYGLTSSSGYSYDSVFQQGWGRHGDLPVGGDLDGDGKMDLMLWRPSNGTWYGLTSSSGYSYDSAFQRGWGLSGDVPVGGDLDGDGKMDLVLWRPSDGTWYGLISSSGYSRDSTFQRAWGQSGDMPVAADLDGDGKMDLVLWRPSNSTWYGLASSSGYSEDSLFQRAWGPDGNVWLDQNMDFIPFVRGGDSQLYAVGLPPDGFLPGRQDISLRLPPGAWCLAAFARGYPALGEQAEMHVSLNGHLLGVFTASLELHPYHVLLRLASGENVLTVTHANDYYDQERGIDRNLLVPLVVVYRSADGCGFSSVVWDH